LPPGRDNLRLGIARIDAGKRTFAATLCPRGLLAGQPVRLSSGERALPCAFLMSDFCLARQSRWRCALALKLHETVQPG